MSIPYIDARHYDWTNESTEFVKWRLSYVGGPAFVHVYLKKLSLREDDTDFLDRKSMAFCPAFASAAITDIKNSIYQRTVDVVRDGGPSTYRDACDGQLGGVDLDLSSMSTFMGTKVLEELLFMRKVGILIDQASNLGTTISDKGTKHPYLGLYCTESILNWAYRIDGNEKYLTAILLQERYEEKDEETGLPMGCTDRYRLMQLLTDEYDNPYAVKVSFFTEQQGPPDAYGNSIREYALQSQPKILDIKRIPFEIIELPHSLMKNAADYQIALLNLEASDVQYARKANFPWFYEFYDPKTDNQFKKPAGQTGDTGGATSQNISRNVEVIGGLSKGRRYPLGTQPPGFINPDPDTLRVSMEKGQQLKDDIRLIVNLNLSAIHPTRASAESKGVDQQGLEGSLSYIGLLLQKAENAIGMHWVNFEGGKDYPKVTYPQSYSLKSDSERLDEADKLGLLKDRVPSDKFKKRILKKIVSTTIGPEIKDSELRIIYAEIDAAQSLTSDAKEIIADHEAGLVSDETASVARGYPKGEVEKAKKDHAEKLARIADAQGGQMDQARGGLSGGSSGSAEKQGQQKRGEAKL